MIAQLGHGWKVEKTNQKITSFAGLPLLTELAHRSKLIRDLDAAPGLWERHGRYETSDYVMSLVLTLIAGGEGLEDTRLLREDSGLQGWLWENLPAPNSLGDFLRRFGHRTISCMGRVNARQVRRLQAGQGTGRVTLDIDSSLAEADKKEAQKNLLAETVHVMGHKSKHERLPAFRLIVTKKLSGQLMANAAYLQVCLIAYNLVQVFKSCALPQSWRKFEIENLRFRLLCRAAKLVGHAGQTILKLSQGYAHFEVFERARWAVLSPALTTSG